MLGEALARCPDLVLVPGDPVLVGEAWEAAVGALEAIGAAVEPARPGLAYFDPDGLRGIHGTMAATIAAAHRAIRDAGGRTIGGELPVRVGAAPTRFGALAAALAARSSRALVMEGSQAQRWLAGRSVGLLGFREDTAALVGPLTRLGVRTLGELARLGRASLCDRFGEAGARAHALVCGEDDPLRTRRVGERLEESMTLGDASSGEALKRVLAVLVSRLLARPERHGRTLRAVTLSAGLLAGGGWRERAVFRQALADPERIWLASSLARAARLREAVAQLRAMAGQDAALRAVCVDPDSRVPERRVVLAPVPER